jgi:hypothetical protein
MDDILETCSSSSGLSAIFAYDNIAIVVLMVIVLQEGVMIYYLLKNLFKIKEVLNSLKGVIIILNERLSHTHHQGTTNTIKED